MENSEARRCVEVPNSEDVYRRGYPQPKYMNPDGTAHSRNFNLKQDEDGISVNIASRSSPEETAQVAGRDPFYVYQLAVSAIRQLGLNVCEDPIVNHPIYPDNLAHALITGMEYDDDAMKVDLARISKRVL